MLSYFPSVLQLWTGRDMVGYGYNIPLFPPNPSCPFQSPQTWIEIVCDSGPPGAGGWWCWGRGWRVPMGES